MAISVSSTVNYRDSTKVSSHVIGYESSGHRVMRYTFTVDGSGANALKLTGKVNRADGNSGVNVSAYAKVSTSSTAYFSGSEASKSWGGLKLAEASSSTYATFSDKTISQNFVPGTTYYLFIYPGVSTYSWGYWGDLTLSVSGSAQWTVTYNKGSNGTGTNTTATKTYGTDLTLKSAIFTRTGYTQTGWSTTDGGTQTHALGATYSTNAALTLYPVWTANKVRIAYNINSGALDGTKTDYSLNSYNFIIKTSGSNWDFHQITYGNSDDPYNASTFGLGRTGYSFGGWYLRTESGTTAGGVLDQDTSYASTKYTQYDDSSKSTANTSTVSCYLYAKWNANTYTVTYDANGGSGTMSASTATYNSGFKTTKNAFTRTGYTFAGWNEKADGTGTAWGISSSDSGTAESGNAWTWTYTKNITLYAQWKINSYTLHVYPQGGTWSGSTSSQDFTLNYNATKSIAVPTRTGYTFGGWSWTTYGTMNNSSFPCSVLSSSNHGISVYNNSQNGSVTHTYVADSSDKSLCSNDHITITKSSTTASPGLGGFYKTVTPAYSTTYIHTFYAKLPVGYYFSYHYNTQPTGSTFTWLTDNRGTGAWKMYGYKLVTGSSGSTDTFGFIAANSDSGSSTATVTWYLGANQVTKSPTSAQTFTATAGNTWMYAMWLQNKYTITYNSNDGTGQTTTSTHYYDDAKNLTENPFERPGYEFLGWSTSSDGEVVYTDTESVVNLTATRDANVNLYAVWKPLSQLFIWHDGAWHRALRYVYTTS